MRTRTRLTTPPGQEPADVDGVDGRARERYSPGLALPEEPDVPGRFRRLAVALVTLALLALLGWAVVQLASTGQSEDPSLEPVPGAPAEEDTSGA